MRLIEEARVAVYDFAERTVPGRDDLARVERDSDLQPNIGRPWVLAHRQLQVRSSLDGSSR